MPDYLVPSFNNLVEKFKSLPGIGEKTAQRLSYHIVNLPQSEVEEFSGAILRAKNSLRLCKICKNYTDEEMCSICKDAKRDPYTVCVVESPKDVASFERSGGFNFKYHVLHGTISPLNGISPSDVYIEELLERVKKNQQIKEVIMATNPTMEGEATALYIKKLLLPFNVKITRLACGVPIGGDLEYTDKITLIRALEGRGEM